MVAGAVFASEAPITGFRNAPAFGEEIQNCSVFIALILKHEIQTIS